MSHASFNASAFDFEKTVLTQDMLNFITNNYKLSVWASAVYVVVIFGGRWIMDRKDKFGLNYALALWSGMLAIFSVIGTARMWPEMLHVLQHEGFYSSACIAGYMEHSVTQFWTGLFVLSKIIELGDTVFIVLRKQPLIFLHWYHHITVLLYSWYSLREEVASGRWFICLNFAVHAVMYSYYALRALKFRVPNQIRMIITAQQLIQMIIGCFLNFYVYSIKNEGRFCQISYENIRLSFLMYFSYFILFAKFFYDTYINPTPRPARLISEEKRRIAKAEQKAD
ncbi:very long chain fatty acid elongase 6-like [Watersipora subatra]|uniref:very long chain fatty acid elongase 6-like n=1 Tax=Watersipora subatra TaxID=2589382 RepID=UPI00355C925B